MEREGGGKEEQDEARDEEPGRPFAMSERQYRDAGCAVVVPVVEGQCPEVRGLPEEDDEKEEQTVGGNTRGIQGGRTELDLNDEITRETLLTRNGEIANQRVRDFYAAAKPASS